MPQMNYFNQRFEDDLWVLWISTKKIFNEDNDNKRECKQTNLVEAETEDQQEVFVLQKIHCRGNISQAFYHLE